MELEERWQEIPIDYRDKVYSIFHRLKFDEPYIIDEKIAPENRTAFKVIAAYFIRWNEGIKFNFYIGFDNKYERIKKFPYWGKSTIADKPLTL